MTKPLSFDRLKRGAKIDALFEVASADVSAFAVLFDRHCHHANPDIFDFASYLETFGDPQAACKAALMAAASHRLLDTLANVMALSPLLGTPERVQTLGGAAVRAAAEAIVNTGTGLGELSDLAQIITVGKAVCLIQEDHVSLGTGFLVGPDLVLTASHVLMQAGAGRDGSTDEQFVTRLRFVFCNQLGATEGKWPLVAQPAPNWKVAWSPPCITEPNGHLLGVDIALALDYALIRLDAAVPPHITPVNIRRGGRVPPGPTLSPAEAGRRYFIVGYPGGTDCKYDAATLHGVEHSAARVLHTLNAVPGMSGSPVLDAQARPMAIHEGKITDANGALLYNRATLLGNILRTLDEVQGDRSRSESKPSHYVASAEMRTAWTRYGETLAKDDGQRQGWRSALLAAVGSEGGIEASDGYYPVIPVPELYGWLTATHGEAETPQVCLVEGPCGSGKSFAIQMARVRWPTTQHVIVPPAIASGLPLHEMAGQLLPGRDFSDSWRTRSGQVRNTYIETLLVAYEKRAAAEPLLIAIDFGRGAYWTEVKSFWLQFLLLAAQRPRLRILVCDAPADFQEDLMLQLAEFVNINLQAPSLRQIVDIAALAAADVGEERQSGHAQALATTLFRDEHRLGKQDGRFAMVDAVRIVLQVKAHFEGMRSPHES